MQRNNTTIYILVAAGLGIYWFMRNKNTKTGGGGGAYQQPDTDLVDINNDIFISRKPINDGGNIEYLDNTEGRGGFSMTEFIDNFSDTSRNIDRDRFNLK